MNNLKETLHTLEVRLIAPDVRSSPEKLSALISDDFVEYGSSGSIYSKEITINSLTSGPSPTYTIYDFEVFILSNECAQTRFKTQRINLGGTELVSLRSSIWKKVNDTWQMYFHQGTSIKTLE